MVVEDEILNGIPENKTSDDAVSAIVREGNILVRCACGRIAIEDKESGTITIYAPEPI